MKHEAQCYDQCSKTVCVLINIMSQTLTLRDRKIDGQTERQIQRQRDRQKGEYFYSFITASNTKVSSSLQSAGCSFQISWVSIIQVFALFLHAETKIQITFERRKIYRIS